MAKTDNSGRLYVGVDVGGTKIQASLVAESGVILARQRGPTPREGGASKVLEAICQSVEQTLDAENLSAGDITAVGVAVPGVVDADRGHVLVTPNMNLSDVPLVEWMEERLRVPVALGNDANLGTLGENWLGSARRAKSVVGIFVGTGIGAGMCIKNKPWTGYRQGAMEIGHMVMQRGGPVCGCGNEGCFEALASRSAIERQIRQAVDAGESTKLTELLDGDLSQIRSGALRDALAAGDELTARVLREASTWLGLGCLNVRHLLDAELIVLGGGVIEACAPFMVPIIEEVLHGDQLVADRHSEVLLAALGDDAVVLGAVAAARKHVKRSPFNRKYRVTPSYPEVKLDSAGALSAGGKDYDRDIYVRVNGKVKKRKAHKAEKQTGSPMRVGLKEIRKVCRGGPEVVFVGTGDDGQLTLTDDAQLFLRRRAIALEQLPTRKAVKAFNKSKLHKAGVFHSPAG
jgi:glucokinase